MKKVKIGVLGVGYLGKIHLQCLYELSDLFEVIGFVDPSEAAAQLTIHKFGTARFESVPLLLQKVDAIDIVTPTSTHFELAVQSISANKHTFIEKPVTSELEAVKALLQLHEKYFVKVQIGHVERFNPAFQAVQHLLNYPISFEARRLATFNTRGNDVSVVFDLMVHDIDLLLHVVQADILEVEATGASVVTNTIDTADARLVFVGGCVAHLSASRVAAQPLRMLEIFQNDTYFKMNLLDKKAQIFKNRMALSAQPFSTPEVQEDNSWSLVEEMNLLASNAIRTELGCFAESILNDAPEAVNLEESYKVMAVAHRIEGKILQREKKTLPL